MELWSPSQLQVSKPQKRGPPLGFEEAYDVTSVCEVGEQPVTPGGFRKSAASAAIAEGLRYEVKAQEHLGKLFLSLGNFQAGIALRFTNAAGKSRNCIPDAVVSSPSAPFPLIIEIKLRHTELAWFQLRKLYQPVVEKYFNKPCIVMEVCKQFDPSTTFPEEPLLVTDPVEFFLSGASAFGIYVWKG